MLIYYGMLRTCRKGKEKSSLKVPEIHLTGDGLIKRQFYSEVFQCIGFSKITINIHQEVTISMAL